MKITTKNTLSNLANFQPHTIVEKLLFAQYANQCG
jgi:hypothetical protein